MIYMHSQPFKMTCKTVKTRDLGRVAEIPHAILHLPAKIRGKRNMMRGIKGAPPRPLAYTVYKLYLHCKIFFPFCQS